MNYLIDGHNLIGKMPDISLDDPDDEVKLVLRLRSWTAVSRKRQVILFFDGGLPWGKSLRLSSSQVKVIFAPYDRTADSLIINRIRQIHNPAEYTLVSSDQEVVDVALGRRLHHITAEAFATQLTVIETPQAATSEPFDPQLDAGEVAKWLELFGPVPERPAPLPPTPPTQAKEPPTMPEIDPADGRHSLNIAKSTPRKLTSEEVDEWLAIFNQGKGKNK